MEQLVIDIKSKEDKLLLTALTQRLRLKSKILITTRKRKSKHIGTTEKERIFKGIIEAMEEVKLHKQGKIKLKSFDEFLNEL